MAHTELFSLTDKVAVVVGGGGVLAGAMAQGLADAGADIAIIDFNAEAAGRRADSIRALGRRASAIQADAAVKKDLERALATTLSELGRVDVLLNAAGINSGTP